SGSIDTNTCGSVTMPFGMSRPPVGYGSKVAASSGTIRMATTRPTPDAVPLRKPRRLTFSIRARSAMAMGARASCSFRKCNIGSCSRRSLTDRRDDPLVATAPANVAGHGLEDLGIRWRLVLGDQAGRLHDLPGLAEAALRYVELAPCHLDRMAAVGAHVSDRAHLPALGPADRDQAGADRRAAEMDRARATQAGAAAVLAAGEPQLVPEVPE